MEILNIAWKSLNIDSVYMSAYFICFLCVKISTG